MHQQALTILTFITLQATAQQKWRKLTINELTADWTILN